MEKRDVEIKHTCHECDHEWTVIMWKESDHESGHHYVGYYDDQEDPFCPKCGHDDIQNEYQCNKCEEE